MPLPSGECAAQRGRRVAEQRARRRHRSGPAPQGDRRGSVRGGNGGEVERDLVARAPRAWQGRRDGVTPSSRASQARTRSGSVPREVAGELVERIRGNASLAAAHRASRRRAPRRASGAASSACALTMPAPSTSCRPGGGRAGHPGRHEQLLEHGRARRRGRTSPRDSPGRGARATAPRCPRRGRSRTTCPSCGRRRSPRSRSRARHTDSPGAAMSTSLPEAEPAQRSRRMLTAAQAIASS